MYRESILAEYRRVARGSLDDEFTHEAKASNPLCGDSLIVRFSIEDGIIKKGSFKSIGCVISTVSASRFLHALRGKQVSDVKATSEETVVSAFEFPIQPARVACALLVLEAIKKAL